MNDVWLQIKAYVWNFQKLFTKEPSLTSAFFGASLADFSSFQMTRYECPLTDDKKLWRERQIRLHVSMTSHMNRCLSFAFAVTNLQQLTEPENISQYFTKVYQLRYESTSITEIGYSDIFFKFSFLHSHLSIKWQKVNFSDLIKQNSE